MAEIMRGPIGTKDILPDEVYKIKYIEDTVSDIAHRYGFKEMRTPTFEATEVFTGAVGETSDIVQKEMYTFTDKGDRSMTLRPEQTAGIARSLIQHGLLNQTLPLKVFCVANAFRYERPQAGRQREFHQINVESYGSPLPVADAEVIAIGYDILEEIGIKSVVTKLNSIGCNDCRPKYLEKLKEYFYSHKEDLDESSLDRLDTNPMRIIDSKVPSTIEIVKNAPKTLDNLCEECSTHFKGVKKNLDNIGVPYEVDSQIVRGLDYYTKTVFEYISYDIGSQSAVGGGGRYDDMIEKKGGKNTPAVGFGMGVERLLLVMENLDIPFPEPEKTEIYISSMGEKSAQYAFSLVSHMRKNGLSAECDLMGKSLKAQMKFADKIDAFYTIVIGDNELEENLAKLRNMVTGDEYEISINKDNILDEISNVVEKEFYKEIDEIEHNH